MTRPHLAEVRDFCEWWREKVQRAGGDRQSQKHSPRTAGMLAMSQAEELTGITSQQVSRWAKALEAEIDRLLDAQEDVVRWWDANVRKGRPKSNAESALLSIDAAESIIGYSQQQISRWRKKLANHGKQGGSRFAKARFGMDKRRAQEWAGIGSEYKELSVIVGQFGADYRAFYEFTRLAVML